MLVSLGYAVKYEAATINIYRPGVEQPVAQIAVTEVRKADHGNQTD